MPKLVGLVFRVQGRYESPGSSSFALIRCEVFLEIIAEWAPSSTLFFQTAV